MPEVRGCTTECGGELHNHGSTWMCDSCGCGFVETDPGDLELVSVPVPEVKPHSHLKIAIKNVLNNKRRALWRHQS